MRLGAKLTIALCLMAVLPTALSAWMAIRRSEDAIIRDGDQAEASAAYASADYVERYLRDAERAVRLGAGLSDLGRLTDAEREGAMMILYRQVDALSIVALLDEHGEGVIPSIYRTAGTRDATLDAHAAVTAAEHSAFTEQIPFTEARSNGRAWSRVYRSAEGEARRVLAVAVAVDGGRRNWVVAAELALGEIERYLRVSAPRPGGAWVFSNDGEVILWAGFTPPPRVPPPVLRGRSASTVRYGSEHGMQRGAISALPALGWRVVQFRPEALAFEPSRRMRSEALFWVATALGIAFVLGVSLARGLAAPVRALAEGARALARGQLGHRVPEVGRDEVGELSRAFNDMARDLERQRAEIEAWNQELQKRVDDRTRELRELQEVAQRSERLAAVAGLGAGVAHEINNPLAAVLGLTQLVLRKLPAEQPERTLLDNVEREALRIRDIVGNLLRMAERTEDTKQVEMQIAPLVDEAIGMVSATLEHAKIKVVRDYQKVPPILCSPPDLRQAILHLIDNAREAMQEGGTLKIEVHSMDDKAVRLNVKDSGRGIAKEHVDRVFDPFFTTKAEWQRKGLGLSVTHKIVEEHGGRIRVQSSLGVGTTMEVVLPAVLRATLLA